jgi:heme/copper-type cytochrome/quinol oxidase subunit 3
LASRGDAGVVSAQETVATPTPLAEEVLSHHASGPRSYAWWGMVCLIATEATLFGLLLASYFYLRFRSGATWPPDGIEKPTLELPLIMSLILWSSSIPVHMADRAIRRGKQLVLRLGLAFGFLLGVAFLAMQLFLEYPETLAEFTPTTNAYGSLFYTITGFHGAHVIVGLMMSAWTQIRAWTGAFDEHRHVTVQIFVMYWHFVDVVWVFVLATIYLSPHF